MKIDIERVREKLCTDKLKLENSPQQYVENRLNNLLVTFAIFLLVSVILLPSAHADFFK